jgi:hypothetical protein
LLGSTIKREKTHRERSLSKALPYATFILKHNLFRKEISMRRDLIRRDLDFISKFLFASALCCTSVVANAGGLAPSTVYVASITYEGSGCPSGSVGQSFSSDRTVFTLIFDQFTANAGPGVSAAESLKDCTLDLEMRAPPNWSWAILGVDTRGYIQLGSGLSAGVTTSFQLAHPIPKPLYTTEFDTPFDGPIAKDYLSRHEMPPMKIDWSQCGGTSNLLIQTTLRIDRGASSGSGQITADSIDGKIIQGDNAVSQGYHFVWRRCD